MMVVSVRRVRDGSKAIVNCLASRRVKEDLKRHVFASFYRTEIHKPRRPWGDACRKLRLTRAARTMEKEVVHEPNTIR
jgi:hypothetical protein